MRTAFVRFKTKASTLAILTAMLVPGVAGAVVLPEHAPLPVDRPAVEVSAQTSLATIHREVAQISTTEQEIPDARRDVRIVGANFLPAAEESIDFTSVGQGQLSGVNTAENFVMSIVTALFERTAEEQPMQVAATTH
ncbi:hypothetical protein [Aliihoeflea sp. PC F10.4]